MQKVGEGFLEVQNEHAKLGAPIAHVVQAVHLPVKRGEIGVHEVVFIKEVRESIHSEHVKSQYSRL